jgi:hypothetical protein
VCFASQIIGDGSSDFLDPRAHDPTWIVPSSTIFERSAEYFSRRNMGPQESDERCVLALHDVRLYVKHDLLTFSLVSFGVSVWRRCSTPTGDSAATRRLTQRPRNLKTLAQVCHGSHFPSVLALRILTMIILVINVLLLLYVAPETRDRGDRGAFQQISVFHSGFESISTVMFHPYESMLVAADSKDKIG